MDTAKLLSGLRRNENSAYQVVYDHYFPVIRRFVIANGGDGDDAEDVFQETVIVLLQKVSNDSFTLTASVKTYVYAVASNIWLKTLRQRKKDQRIDGQLELVDLTLSEWEAREEQRRQDNVLVRVLRKVTRHCFVFLTKTFLKGVTRERLMEEMGYRSAHTFDNQKYKCLEQARKNIA